MHPSVSAPPTPASALALPFVTCLPSMGDSLLFRATFTYTSLNLFVYLPFSFSLSSSLLLSCLTTSVLVSLHLPHSPHTRHSHGVCAGHTSDCPVPSRDIPQCPSAHSSCKQRVPLLPPTHTLSCCSSRVLWSQLPKLSLALLSRPTGGTPPPELLGPASPPRRTGDPCADTPSLPYTPRSALPGK
jgi:hypothetical protein